MHEINSNHPLEKMLKRRKRSRNKKKKLMNKKAEVASLRIKWDE